jgi:hypothetical protein
MSRRKLQVLGYRYMHQPMCTTGTKQRISVRWIGDSYNKVLISIPSYWESTTFFSYIISNTMLLQLCGFLYFFMRKTTTSYCLFHACHWLITSTRPTKLMSIQLGWHMKTNQHSSWNIRGQALASCADIWLNITGLSNY